ncbi:MAG: hypothetical protein GY929_18385 [Actinomycetia bacterium]|nr:hypothetical protein [Actinomycetes bacterium]
MVAPVGVQNADAAINHAQTVPELPRANFPQILDGDVLAADRVADWLLVGGSFTQIKLDDGSVVNQRYLAAFDINTGAFVDTFRPVLDGKVLTIEEGATWREAFIGGAFKNVDGVPRFFLAKLDLFAESIDPSWNADTNGWVYDLARHDDRLFVGGNFTTIGGSAHNSLAEVSASTDAVASFSVGITGSRRTGCRDDGWCETSDGAPVVQGLAVRPDGNTLIVAHTGYHVGGQVRWGAAVVDLTTANGSVHPWNISHNWPSGDFVGITSAALSPDGNLLVISNKIGNFPPIHDTVVAYETDPTQFTNSAVNPRWVTQMFDSVFSVAVSDSAVYAGGHFCWTEGPGSTALGWPGANGNQYSCKKGGAGGFANTVYRYHQAALDLTTGTALPWDSHANSFTGARFMEVIDRGLLVGHDGDRLKDVLVGRFGFYDLGAAFDDTPGRPGVPTCSAVKTGAGGAVDVTWDDALSTKWSVRRSNGWLATVDAPATTYQDVPGIGTHDYVLRQLNGPKNDIVCGSITFDAPDLDTTDPETGVSEPALPGEILDRGIAPAGQATDDVGVTFVRVEIRDNNTDLWLQADGTWGGWVGLAATLDNPGGLSTGWSYPVNLANGSYTVWARAFDAAGNRDETKPSQWFKVRAGGPDTVAPNTTYTTPAADGDTVPLGTSIAGAADDDRGVARVWLEVYDTANFLWLQPDGTWAVAWARQEAVLGSPGAAITTWTLGVQLPAGTYRVDARAFDTSNNRDDIKVRSSFTMS